MNDIKRTVGAGAIAMIPLLSAQVGHAAATTTGHWYKGPDTEMRWGDVQVSIYAANKKITKVKTAYSVHAGRSEFITGDALPILKSEVLQAQSAEIDQVSRATDTSDAFITSLQGAIKSAHKHKALK